MKLFFSVVTLPIGLPRTLINTPLFDFHLLVCDLQFVLSCWYISPLQAHWEMLWKTWPGVWRLSGSGWGKTGSDLTQTRWSGCCSRGQLLHLWFDGIMLHYALKTVTHAPVNSFYIGKCLKIIQKFWVVKNEHITARIPRGQLQYWHITSLLWELHRLLGLWVQFKGPITIKLWVSGPYRRDCFFPYGFKLSQSELGSTKGSLYIRKYYGRWPDKRCSLQHTSFRTDCPLNQG